MNPLTEVFGSTPEAIKPDLLNLSDEQIKSLLANIGAFKDIGTLGSLYQQYMLSQLNTAIPGFSDILKQGGGLITQMQGTAAEQLAGKIPADVLANLQRSTAWENLQSGAGGGMADANFALKNVLTSEHEQQLGLQTQQAAGNAAQQWAGIASGTMMNPSTYMINPMQQAAVTQANNQAMQAYRQLKANLAAAPNPVAKGVSDTIINLIGAYLGAGKGGGAGGTAPNAWSNTFGPNGPTGPSQGQMSTLAQNYGQAGMPITFGQSGYPAAIPVDYGGIPMSQYGGVMGSISNLLGGNLHWGG